MGKSAKKKSYTEDVVLNKILKDISEENLHDPSDSSVEHHEQSTYKDDLMKHYRQTDASQHKNKYIWIVKISIVLLLTIILILVFGQYGDTPPAKQTQLKKIPIQTPNMQPKIEKVSKPVQIEVVKAEQKEAIPMQEKSEKSVPIPTKNPLQKVKSERELAKERLLQQMKN